nr:putative reverse transcriptase domain-containing protein [Tanacetum cinerariifolium]
MSLEKARLELKFTQLLFRDMSLDRMEWIEYDVETLKARVDVVELRARVLQLALADARKEIMELRTRVSALEQRAQGPQRLIELFNDYDCEIRYHPGKANVVADALSMKERLKPRRVRAMSMTIYSGLKTKNLKAQGEASKDLKAPTKMLRGLDAQVEKQDDRGIYFIDRIWIPSVGDVRKLIMDEAHNSKCAVHPGAYKMYYDLRDLYWWPRMKKDIAEYVSKCLTSPVIWAEVEESQLIGPEIIQETTEKIMQIKERKGKLAPQYVGPFEIVKRVRPVAYLLRLPRELSSIHDTFHLSNLKKCLADVELQVYREEIEIDDKLNFVEEPVQIVEREVKKLKRKRIPIVKVRWNSKRRPEFT